MTRATNLPVLDLAAHPEDRMEPSGGEHQAVTWRPALEPAMRPNTAPEVRPVPPG